MSQKDVQIAFQDIEAWEENREKVYKILEELTGTSHYPSTKLLPPIIFGAKLAEDGIQRLRDLDGVIVHVSEDDD